MTPSKRVDLLITGGIIFLLSFYFPIPVIGSDISEKRVDTFQRMNVLFIAIDDLNDWVCCMGGNPQVRTPHLDDFHAEGAMVMYNAHAPYPSDQPRGLPGFQEFYSFRFCGSSSTSLLAE